MKLVVDRDRCQGHARCQALAPDLFEVDDAEQKSRVRVDEVPAPLEAAAWSAIRTCPEGAIHGR